jgi:DNA-directed RNA polymerase specialized sigma24 family protein
MKNSNNNRSRQNQDKKTLSLVHLLYPYVKQRIRVGENLGILPRNMYKSNEIIDEVVLEIYEQGAQNSMDTDALRIDMFEKANTKINLLLESEKWHKDSISTKLILEQELKQLEENFTMDADNDYVMNEDLDDISYHQNDKQNTELPYDDAEEGMRTLLEIENFKQVENWNDRRVLRKLYYKLPLNSSNIIDLYVLGKLSFQEIATILKMNILEVKQIISFVKENFKKWLE